MKFKLRSVEKAIEDYKTQRKSFKLPYFETISISPVLEIAEEDVKALSDFFYEFNNYMSDIQIGIDFSEFKEEGEDV